MLNHNLQALIDGFLMFIAKVVIQANRVIHENIKVKNICTELLPRACLRSPKGKLSVR